MKNKSAAYRIGKQLNISDAYLEVNIDNEVSVYQTLPRLTDF
ncbi:hypothetical protein ACS127_02075 [Amphibacillus sp. Q70]